MYKDTGQQDDQAAELRKLIGDVQANEPDEEDVRTNDSLEPDEEDDIDILNLPPRKTVHQNKKSTLKFKINRPLLRLLTVVIILIIVMVLAWLLIGDSIWDNFMLSEA